MLKKISLIIMLLGAYGVSEAQFLKFGLRAGANSSNFRTNDFSMSSTNGTGGISNISSGGSNFGVHGGAALRINLGENTPLYFQPELLITSTGGEYRVDDGDVQGPSLASVNFTRLDFPILAGLKFGPFRVNAGPIGSINLSQDNGLTEVFSNARQEFSTATWGYQAGAGIDVLFLSLDVRYEGQFNKAGESVTIAGTDYTLDTRINQWVFGLTFWLN